jgi:hypothetical protein
VARLKATLPGELLALRALTKEGAAALAEKLKKREKITLGALDSTVKLVEMGGAGKKNTVEWVRSLRRMAGLKVAGSSV